MCDTHGNPSALGHEKRIEAAMILMRLDNPIIAVVEDAGPVPVCCGEPMELLVAGAKDAAAEKHVPDVTR